MATELGRTYGRELGYYRDIDLGGVSVEQVAQDPRVFAPYDLVHRAFKNSLIRHMPIPDEARVSFLGGKVLDPDHFKLRPNDRGFNFGGKSCHLGHTSEEDLESALEFVTKPASEAEPVLELPSDLDRDFDRAFELVRRYTPEEQALIAVLTMMGHPGRKNRVLYTAVAPKYREIGFIPTYDPHTRNGRINHLTLVPMQMVAVKKEVTDIVSEPDIAEDMRVDLVDMLHENRVGKSS
jgi:hypothetical protein